MSFLSIVFLSFFLVASLGAYTLAQVNLSAIVDLAYKQDILTGGDELHSDINTANRGDSPFNLIRVKLFVDGEITEDISVFTTLLFDSGADARVDGAYVEFANVFGDESFNIHAGRIPTPFGSFAPRTLSSINPLIGIPLIYHYHSTAQGDRAPQNNAEQLSWRDKPPKYASSKTVGYQRRGMPLLYDPCWNTGIELYGFISIFEYALGATKGTLSHPRAEGNEGAQAVVRLGLNPIMGMRIGLSGAYGPYFEPAAKESTNFPKDKALESFYQLIYGIDFEYSYGYFQFFLEAVRNQWDVPNITEGKLGSIGGYVEGKYTILPGLYYALRYDQIIYDGIDDGSGNKVPWDYGIKRVETGFGYDIVRNVAVKLVGQLNFKDAPANDDPTDYDPTDYMVVAQLSTSF